MGKIEKSSGVCEQAYAAQSLSRSGIYARQVAVGKLPLALDYAQEADFAAGSLKPGIHAASATSTYYATGSGRVKDEDKDD